MAKYFGKIGYAKTMEVHPGVYEEVITFKSYRGDLIRNTRQMDSKEINGEISISNQVSILADPYTMQNIYGMRCIEFAGTLWKITNVDIQYPRLIISLGGVFNDENTRVAPRET